MTQAEFLGHKPINPSRRQSSCKVTHPNAYTYVPVLKANEIINFIADPNPYATDLRVFIAVHNKISQQSFAFQGDSVIDDPRFNFPGSVIVADPNMKPQDDQYAVITLDNINITIKKVIKASDTIFFKAVSENQKNTMNRTDHMYDKAKHKILATVCCVVRDLELFKRTAKRRRKGFFKCIRSSSDHD